MQNNEKQIAPTSHNFQKSAARPLKNAAAYEAFIEWYALPRHEKVKEGLETQKQFADYHGVTERTLVDWTKRYDFEPRCEEHIHRWTKRHKPDIVAAIYAGAVNKLNPLAQMLWLKAFEGFTEKTQVETTHKVEVTVTRTP